MSKGNVKKYTKSKGYESISRNMVQDIKHLSLQAIGLLSYLISLPDNFEIFKTVLYKKFSKNGRRSVITAWNQLVDRNYIVQFRKRNDKGNWDYIYYFSQERFTDEDIKLIEKEEGTKQWDGKNKKKKEKSINHPLYILNSSEPVNGNRSIYRLTNKDLLLNKDIDKDIDTIDTGKSEIKKTKTSSKTKNDYTIDSFYNNQDFIPASLADMLKAFYGDDIDSANKIYKIVLIAKNKIEKETNTVIQLDNDHELLELVINSLSRSIRVTEKEKVDNPGGYIYKSIYSTIKNVINSRIRQIKQENSDIYHDWLKDN